MFRKVSSVVIIILIFITFILSITNLINLQNSQQNPNNDNIIIQHLEEIDVLVINSNTSFQFQTKSLTNNVSKLANLDKQISSIDKFFVVNNVLQVGTINTNHTNASLVTICTTEVGQKDLAFSYCEDEEDEESNDNTKIITFPSDNYITGGLIISDNNGSLNWVTPDNVAQLSNGSQSKPSFAFSNDQSVGLFLDSQNENLNLVVNNTSQLEIQSTGVNINNDLIVNDVTIHSTSGEISGLNKLIMSQLTSATKFSTPDDTFNITNGVISGATSLISEILTTNSSTIVTNGNITNVENLICSQLNVITNATVDTISINNNSIANVDNIICQDSVETTNLVCNNLNINNDLKSLGSVTVPNVDVNFEDISTPALSVSSTNIGLGKINTDSLTIGNNICINSSSNIIGSINNNNISFQPQLNQNIVFNVEDGNDILSNLSLPSSLNGLATKQYVDNVSQGLIETSPVVVKTNVPLPTYTFQIVSGFGSTYIEATDNGSINDIGIDGITTLVQSDRILITSEGTNNNDEQNGIYQLTTVGDAQSKWRMTRTLDLLIPNTYIAVDSGFLHIGTGWGLMLDGLINIDITPLVFSQVSQDEQVSIVSNGGGTEIYSSQSGSILKFKTIGTNLPVALENKSQSLYFNANNITKLSETVNSGSISTGFGNIQCENLSDGTIVIDNGDLTNILSVNSTTINNSGLTNTNSLTTSGNLTCNSTTFIQDFKSNNASINTLNMSHISVNTVDISSNNITNIYKLHFGNTTNIDVKIDNPSTDYKLILPNDKPHKTTHTLVTTEDIERFRWSEVPFPGQSIKFVETSNFSNAYYTDINNLHYIVCPKYTSQITVKLWGGGGGSYTVAAGGTFTGDASDTKGGSSTTLHNGQDGGYTTITHGAVEGDIFVLSVGAHGGNNSNPLIGGQGGQDYLIVVKSISTNYKGGGNYTALHSFNENTNEYTLIACAGGGSPISAGHSQPNDQLPNNYPDLTLTNPTDFGGNGFSGGFVAGGGGYTGGNGGSGGGGYVGPSCLSGEILLRQDYSTDQELLKSPNSVAGTSMQSGLIWISFSGTFPIGVNPIAVSNTKGNYFKIPVLSNENRPLYPTNGTIYFDTTLDTYLGYKENSQTWVSLH